MAALFAAVFGFAELPTDAKVPTGYQAKAPVVKVVKKATK